VRARASRATRLAKPDPDPHPHPDPHPDPDPNPDPNLDPYLNRNPYFNLIPYPNPSPNPNIDQDTDCEAALVVCGFGPVGPLDGVARGGASTSLTSSLTSHHPTLAAAHRSSGRTSYILQL
jgi:hypothetical protein